MGSFVCGAFNHALVSFTEAATLMPMTSNYRDGVSLAQRWTKQPNGGDIYMHDLGRPMTMLPKGPIQLPEYDTKSAIASLDI